MGIFENKSKLASKMSADLVSALADTTELTPEQIAASYQDAADICVVDVHCHMVNMAVNLGKLTELSYVDGEDADYMEKSSSGVVINAFSKEARKLTSIGKGIHKKLADLGIGHSHYMTLDDFEGEFLPYLFEKEAEMETVKETILATFDERVEEFKKRASTIAATLCPSRQAVIEAEVARLASISPDDFIAKIGVSLVTDFSAEMVSEETYAEYIRKAKIEQATQKAAEIYGGLFEDAWKALISYASNLANITSDDLLGCTALRENLSNASKRLSKANLTLKSSALETIASAMMEVSKETCRLDAVDTVFDALSICFGFAEEKNGIELPLTKKMSAPVWVNKLNLAARFKELTA